jgi:hypothetical protein
LLTACAADPPVIDEIAPGAAPRGSAVRVQGSGLCGGIEGCAPGHNEHHATLWFLGPDDVRIAADAGVTWTDEIWKVEVPAAATVGSTQVFLTTDDDASNMFAFEVTP